MHRACVHSLCCCKLHFSLFFTHLYIKDVNCGAFMCCGNLEHLRLINLPNSFLMKEASQYPFVDDHVA